MDNLEYIDNYFHAEKDPDQTRLFEQKIQNDASFAADLAFYLSARQVAGENHLSESRDRFRNLYEANKNQKPEKGRLVALNLRWIAIAAVVAAVVFGVFISQKRESPEQLADQFIKTEMKTLGLTMGREDELQKGSNLYNQQKYTEALVIFENLIRTDSTNIQALENAGKACIQLAQYDKALTYFRSMDAHHIYAEPGKFYEALILLKRNQAGDKDQAKLILQEIVTKDLNNEAIAEKWLKDF
jgi:tetratricopeptide (TPR) repeat protein